MGTVTSGIDVVELAEFGGASDLVFDLIAVFVDQLCVESVSYTHLDPDLTPEDWTTGNEEDIEIGTKEDFITPGGQANDWQQGEDEQVTFDSTNLQFR